MLNDFILSFQIFFSKNIILNIFIMFYLALPLEKILQQVQHWTKIPVVVDLGLAPSSIAYEATSLLYSLIHLS